MFSRRPGVLSLLSLLLLTSLVLTAGCSNLALRKWQIGPIFSTFSGPGGDLTISSISNADLVLKAGFEHGIYSAADKNTVTIVLYDGPIENPSQALTIRMFWNPHVGRTPIDPTATNATMQYVIFPDGGGDGKEDKDPKKGNGKQLGIYSGAGYLYPNTDVGDSTLIASVWQSTLRISDKTDGFYDRLGQAMMKGRVTLKRDDLGVHTTITQLNIMIRQRLGKARLIRLDRDPSHMLASRQP